MNIWSINPFSTCAQAVAWCDDWRDFEIWTDVVSGRRFAQLMGLPADVMDADLHTESHSDIIEAAKGRASRQAHLTNKQNRRSHVFDSR